MLLRSATGSYRIGAQPLAATTVYRLYLAKEEASGRWRLVQVASTKASNGALERAAFILEMFQRTAVEFDREYTTNIKAGRHLHLDRLYPQLVESGVSPEQGERRINIYDLADIDDIRRIVPLANLRLKSNLRIDPETSAWVVGRLLKMLSFTQGEGIANRSLSAGNVLLDPQQHFAVTLDWSNAFVYQESVPVDVASAEIADAARAVFWSLGGLPDGSWPYDGHHAYVEMLRRLMDGSFSDADKALDAFYDLVRTEYGASFHPFTTLPL